MRQKLETLFDQPIVSIKTLGEQYDGRTNDVWLVSLQDETEYVVRSRRTNRNESEFTAGISLIYGVDAHAVQDHIDQINRRLSQTKSFHIPAVIRQVQISGRNYTVMEKVEGTSITTLKGRTPAFYEDYGRKLARFHAYQTHFFGAVYGGKRHDLKNFNQQLKKAVHHLTSHYYVNQPEIVRYEKIVQQKLEELSLPESSSLILIDLDATQYIERDGKVMCLVDTEYVVFGPAEFDFIALEYLLTKEAAHFVQRGYEDIRPLPKQLHEVRECYRFVSFLLDIHGSWDVQKWMNHPVFFHSQYG
ncbi:phosphotransferase [Bacillus sp. LLTC93]|uniref:phosphotransferase n=1 Tax=Bacillus sp. LLTC93 TaxID=2108274 RepID=UPI000D012091|nr:phosphotransferase [Bacillus sp. LLTC93]PRO43263.1 hypothetical protein C6W18_04895 [Bacillus sp. LLTC93]